MELPLPKPTAVERKYGRRLNYPGRGTTAPAPRPLSEGAEVLKGIGAGIPAGLAGLPADIAALLFRDAPVIFYKLGTGESLNPEEYAFFRNVTRFQENYGAETRLRQMGFGENIDAESDSPDALTQAGMNPFRQGAMVGEFLADPFLIGKGIKASKAYMSGRKAAGPGSTDDLADAAAGDAAARASDEGVLDVTMPRAANVDEVIDPAFRQGIGYQNMIRDPDLAGMTDDQLVARYNDEVDTFNTTFFSTADGVDRDAAQIQFDRATMSIQNELMGRRGGELSILGLDGVAALRIANEQATAAAPQGREW